MNISDTVTPSVISSGDIVFKVTLLLISCPLIVLTIVGNALVIFIWFIHQPIRTPQNAYFISLAFVDLLTGLFAFPITVAYSYTRQWEFGLPMCRVWLVGCFTLYSSTAFHLVVIAADRYRALTEGVSYLQRRSFRGVVETVIIIWVLGIWVTGPIILDWEHTSKDPTGQKHCLSNKIPYWVAHIWFTSYAFPAFLIIRIYVKVFSEIRKRLGLKTVEEMPGTMNPISDDTEEKSESSTMSSGSLLATPANRVAANIVQEEVADAKRRLRYRREKKSAVTLGIIIGAFLICWAPWYFLSLYDVVVPVEYKASPYLFMFSAIFGLANSCFNPIVYAARVPEFQFALRKMYTNILQACGRPTP